MISRKKLILYVLVVCLLVIIMPLNAATQGEIKVGKIWVHPNASNYGYFGNIEYPGSSNDYYILQLSMAFTCSVMDEDFVFFGGVLGQSELDYSIQEADGLHQEWTQMGDERSVSVLRATGDFSEYSSSTPLHLEHTTEIRGYNHPDYDDFILVTHSFANTGTDTVEDLHLGYHLPADVGASGVTTRELDDFAAYDTDNGIAYMYDDDGDDGVTPYYVGQALLSAPPAGGTSDDLEVSTQPWTTFNYYLMVNPIAGADELYDKLTANVIDEDTGSKGPYTIISAVGPYSILPGGELSFTVGIVYGEGLESLQENTEKAEELVGYNFAIPAWLKPPQTPEIESIEVSGKLANLTWDSEAEESSDFAGYKVYRSQVSSIGAWDLVVDQDADPTGNSYLDLDVQVGFPYFYTITSYDTDGNESGKWSEVCRTLDALRPANNPFTNMDRIKVVPNPYLGGANWELQDYESTIYFTRLPEECTIHIYTLTGEEVVVLDHNRGDDQTWDDSGDESWNLLSKNRQAVASGLYLYRVVAEDGEEFAGRFVIVRGER
ncbi:MAG: hypothetical protein QF712_03395 [Candidatus Marinimicrobia bacterium]|jgi:hypothetical protein|nr:hypothetical protein [Candidatus Neomarinimicrobiota bacterium]MDP7483637.1 hypothetical protein [Candidatus Neomarinimicrobiota bacterium]|tara:strand:+ start:1744 stop:3387 length:1644 start_codon:yes stop_codon:yes gene_type:complete